MLAGRTSLEQPVYEAVLVPVLDRSQSKESLLASALKHHSNSVGPITVPSFTCVGFLIHLHQRNAQQPSQNSSGTDSANKGHGAVNVTTTQGMPLRVFSIPANLNDDNNDIMRSAEFDHWVGESVL